MMDYKHLKRLFKCLSGLVLGACIVQMSEDYHIFAIAS